MTTVSVGAVDVVVLDLQLPHGLLLARRLLLRDPLTRIVVVRVSDEEASVVAWADAGVGELVGVRASLDDLVASLEGAARGERSGELRMLSAAPEARVVERCSASVRRR